MAPKPPTPQPTHYEVNDIYLISNQNPILRSAYTKTIYSKIHFFQKNKIQQLPQESQLPPLNAQCNDQKQKFTKSLSEKIRRKKVKQCTKTKRSISIPELELTKTNVHYAQSLKKKRNKHFYTFFTV